MGGVTGAAVTAWGRAATAGTDGDVAAVVEREVECAWLAPGAGAIGTGRLPEGTCFAPGSLPVFVAAEGADGVAILA